MFLVISSSFDSFYRLCSTETLKFCFNHNLLDGKESNFFDIKCFTQAWFHVKHREDSLFRKVFLQKSPILLLAFLVRRAVHL